MSCNGKVYFMRLFIAIQLGEKSKQQIEDVKTVFRWQNIHGNYVPKENLHITLAFIGEYGDPDRVMEVLEEISFQAFGISIGGVSCSGKAWWAEVENCPELDSLARQIRHLLADAEIPYDKKKFNPHVTFLRKPDYSRGRITYINAEPVSMVVSCFSLMQSTQGKNSMIYTELGSVEAQ